MSNHEMLELSDMVKAMNPEEQFIVANAIPAEIILDSLRVRYTEMNKKLESISKLISQN